MIGAEVIAALITDADEHIKPSSENRSTPETRSTAMIAPDRVRRWSAAELAAALHCSHRELLGEVVPMLVAAGALRKVGRGWFGALAEIESVLMNRALMNRALMNRTKGRAR